MTWKDYITEAEDHLNPQPENLHEKLVKKVMVQDGKKIKKYVSDKPGFKVQYDKNHMPREIKISPQEKLRRKQAQRKAKIKRQSEMKLLQKRRLKSFNRRDAMGLDYNKDVPKLVTAREEGDKIPSDIKGALQQKLNNMKNSLHNQLAGHI